MELHYTSYNTNMVHHSYYVYPGQPEVSGTKNYGIDILLHACSLFRIQYCLNSYKMSVERWYCLL